MARYCFQLQVRPDRLGEYRARHQTVWPDMLAALRDTGWRNYSLFLRPDVSLGSRSGSKKGESPPSM